MRVAHHLRELGVEHRLAYFHHIPFPAPDIYRRLPWRESILRGLLEYDLVGFQTLRDRKNFVATARDLLPELRSTNHRRHTAISFGDREVMAGNYPISIDFDEFAETAASEEVERQMEEILRAYPAERLVLGLDRLDYTKGIPERFRAFERLLEKYPEFRGKVSLIQVVVPSRTAVATYAELKEGLDQLIGRINGRFGRHGYVPIHYYFKHLDRPELIAHYRACSVALLTPLRDGMNLVAKEYAASQVKQDGVLVLSEFTGSADQFGKDAVLVNPYDLEETADRLREALVMDREERRRRMKRLRRQVRRNDVHRWVGWFMDALYDDKEERESRKGN
jgi:trehalose 6-phosphate synthase